MCLRARLRISLMSVRKGLLAMRALISPLAAERCRLAIVDAAAPSDLSSHAGKPDRTQKNVKPEAHHERMQKNRVEQRIADRTEDRDARDADQNHGRDRNPIASERENVGKKVQDDNEHEQQHAAGEVAADREERVLR